MNDNTQNDLNPAEVLRILSEQIAKEKPLIGMLREEVGKVIVGQTYMVDRLLIALLADGHVLLEGVPGLAKTLAIKTLSEAINVDFSRIQFTPDLLPADVTGTLIYNQKSESFTVKKGPIFANFVLADEINRAPAKVQSALLESHAGTTNYHRRYDLPIAETILSIGNAKPYRTGRNLSVARSASRSIYAQG